MGGSFCFFSPYNVIGIMLWYIVITVIVILLVRHLVCWYWKINEEWSSKRKRMTRKKPYWASWKKWIALIDQIS